MRRHASPRIRRVIPATLARIPSQQTVDAMLRLVLAPETDQLLDYRTLKALSKLRAAQRDLAVRSGLVYEVAQREAGQGALCTRRVRPSALQPTTAACRPASAPPAPGRAG
jgi:hypothetical protein